MLPASSSYPNPPRTASPAATSSNAGLGLPQIILVAGLVLYAFVVGIGLLSHIARPERAFLLMAAPCCIPAIWYANAYFQSRGERDSGLLLSAIGWLLIALALVFKQSAVAAAGYVLNATSPMVPVCATFGVLCLLIGALFSWLSWASDEESSTEPRSAHY